MIGSTLAEIFEFNEEIFAGNSTLTVRLPAASLIRYPLARSLP